MKPIIKLDPVKVVQCRECGVDVTVNAAYPIDSVSCQTWYCPKLKPDNSDKNL